MIMDLDYRTAVINKVLEKMKIVKTKRLKKIMKIIFKKKLAEKFDKKSS